MYIYITCMYDINNIIPSMFEIEMVLAFSKLSHQKEIQPRKKKVPCSSFGTASRKKTIQCRLKDPIWRTFTHYMVSKQMWHRNLPRRRPKRNAAPVSRVTWKEKKIMSNAILPETEQIWKDLTWNVKVPEKDNFWIRITSNMIVPEKEKNGNDFTSNVKVPEKEKLLKRNRIKYAGSWKGQIWKIFHTSNVKVPERDNFWKEIASKCIKYNGSWKGQIWKIFHSSNVKVPERENFWKEITSYMIALGKGKKLYKKLLFQ